MKHRFKSIDGAARRVRELEKIMRDWQQLAEKLDLIADTYGSLLAGICAGVARWEPFDGTPDRGEICVGGMRYFARLDGNGCPDVNVANAIAQAMRIAKAPPRPSHPIPDAATAGGKS